MNLELFPCSGGMAEGFRRVGIKFDVAVDWDSDAVESYAHNLGHRPVQMDVRDLVRLVSDGFAPHHVNLLVADPPCTPWSRAGKRQGLEDDRDMLRETCSLIALLKPERFLIGNVPGLADSTNDGAVELTIGALRKVGYHIDYASLDAADFGVPQHRVRPFWFGHRRAPCISWPMPTHEDPQRHHNLAIPGTQLKPWVTCRDALQHLPLEELGRPVRMKWKPDADHRPSEAVEPGKTLTRNTHSDGALLSVKHMWMAPPGHHDWPWNRPGTTTGRGGPAVPSARWHRRSFRTAANAIVLSERAAAILQGFPENWRFHGATKKARWAQIGMAMPPALAEAVARQIADLRFADAI